MACVFIYFLGDILKQFVFFVFNFEPFSPIIIRSHLFSVWTVCSLFGDLQCVKLPDNNLIYLESVKGNV